MRVPQPPTGAFFEEAEFSSRFFGLACPWHVTKARRFQPPNIFLGTGPFESIWIKSWCSGQVCKSLPSIFINASHISRKFLELIAPKLGSIMKLEWNENWNVGKTFHPSLPIQILPFFFFFFFFGVSSSFYTVLIEQKFAASASKDSVKLKYSY